MGPTIPVRVESLWRGVWTRTSFGIMVFGREHLCSSLVVIALAFAETFEEDVHTGRAAQAKSARWRSGITDARALRQEGSAPAGWALFMVMVLVAALHRSCSRQRPVLHAIDFAFRARRPDMLEEQYERQTTIELSAGASPRINFVQK